MRFHLMKIFNKEIKGMWKEMMDNTKDYKKN